MATMYINKKIAKPKHIKIMTIKENVENSIEQDDTSNEGCWFGIILFILLFTIGPSILEAWMNLVCG